MPGGDRTGPAGMGPMTGRGRGFCAGAPAPRDVTPTWGRSGGGAGGRGGGPGGGWRHRHWYYATGLPGWQRTPMADPRFAAPGQGPIGPWMTGEEELEVLKNQALTLEQALEDLRTRIRDVESPAEDSKTT